MLENAEKIVLDAKNNKYTGPEGQFTIVIDDFDGKAVQAWHIETPRAKTDNLAERAQGRHIDVVVGEACHSTTHFFNRVYKNLEAKVKKELMTQ